MANTLTTNLSLQIPVQENITPQDRINLQGAEAANAAILEKAIAGVQSAAVTGVNASVININGNKLVQLQLLSAGCIATIIGQVTGVPFILLFQSIGSMTIVDTGVFKLSAAFTPTVDDTLTLVWDGNNFYEVTRSAN